jgi:uncharacterized protein YndB with AHSA1/START domain
MADHRPTTITFPTDEQVLITAVLDAPSLGLFRAFTTPDLVTQWWGRPAGHLTTCEIDLRVGGRWHYVYRPEGGQAVGFHGVYREIVPGTRLAYTDVLEDLGGVEARNTVSFTTENGCTVMRILAEHVSKANRDIQSATLNAESMVVPFQLLEQIAQSVGTQ